MRGKRKAVNLNDQQAQGVQDYIQQQQQLEQQQRNQEAEARARRNQQAMANLQTFQTATDLGTKATAAQAIQQSLNDQQLDQQTRQQLGQFARGLHITEWLALHKTMTDLTEVGQTAQKYIEPEVAFNPPRTLQQLIQDQNLDPFAKQVAQQFLQTLPSYKAVKDNPAFKGGDPVSITEDEIMVPGKKDYHGKQFTKDVIVDQDDQILMKPGGGDDPRGLGTLSRTWEHFLVTKPKRNEFQTQRDPVEILGDGIAVVMDNPDSSKLMKDVNRQLVERAKDLDHRRTHDMMRGADQRLNKQVSRTFDFDR